MNSSIPRLISILALAFTTFATATTRHVPSEYGSIQSAIHAAVPGDTIQVAAGTYAEQLVINKPLTLLGPQAGVSGHAAGRGADPSAEAVITYPAINFSSPSSRSLLYLGTSVTGITVDGFTFRDVEVFPSGWYGYLVFASNVQDLVIRNNRFFGGQTAINAFYTTSQTGFASGMVVERNFLDGGPFVNCSVGRGIAIQGTAATVQDNVL
ncbi:MAG: DUF1565 domain-containing protein, partial [Verrucomicrobia bacterium]|nr:DUF1565 domain-containing protein [Verrucomicrobiota bacterium]